MHFRLAKGLKIKYLSAPKILLLAGLSIGCIGKLERTNPYDPNGINPGPGKVWREATAQAAFSARAGHISLVFQDQMWVIGGSLENDIWSSSDGITWTYVSDIPLNFFFGGGIVFKNKIWLMGWDQKVWSSVDGATWKLETGSAAYASRYFTTTVVFHDAIWMIDYAGEVTGSIWYSLDGINWVDAGMGVEFPTRTLHSTVVANGNMYVIGGRTDPPGDYASDVWSSSNGINWGRLTSTAGFGPRLYHSSVAFDGKIWVINGLRQSGPFVAGLLDGEIWSSLDGVSWTLERSLPFPGRFHHSSIVYDNKIWVIGGRDNEGARNDVWFSP